MGFPTFCSFSKRFQVGLHLSSFFYWATVFLAHREKYHCLLWHHKGSKGWPYHISERDRCWSRFSATFISDSLVPQAVDYESRSSYSFSVEVLNPMVDPRFLRRGPFKDRASIRVAVLDADEPPRFSRSRYHMDVSENCPPACTVGRVSAVDPDTGLTNNIRYVSGLFVHAGKNLGESETCEDFFNWNSGLTSRPGQRGKVSKSTKTGTLVGKMHVSHCFIINCPVNSRSNKTNIEKCGKSLGTRFQWHAHGRVCVIYVMKYQQIKKWRIQNLWQQNSQTLVERCSVRSIFLSTTFINNL